MSTDTINAAVAKFNAFGYVTTTSLSEAADIHDAVSGGEPRAVEVVKRGSYLVIRRSKRLTYADIVPLLPKPNQAIQGEAVIGDEEFSLWVSRSSMSLMIRRRRGDGWTSGESVDVSAEQALAWLHVIAAHAKEAK